VSAKGGAARRAAAAARLGRLGAGVRDELVAAAGSAARGAALPRSSHGRSHGERILRRAAQAASRAASGAPAQAALHAPRRARRTSHTSSATSLMRAPSSTGRGVPPAARRAHARLSRRVPRAAPAPQRTPRHRHVSARRTQDVERRDVAAVDDNWRLRCVGELDPAAAAGAAREGVAHQARNAHLAELRARGGGGARELAAACTRGCGCRGGAKGRAWEKAPFSASSVTRGPRSPTHTTPSAPSSGACMAAQQALRSAVRVARASST
jgi:hypothetical protein